MFCGLSLYGIRCLSINPAIKPVNREHQACEDFTERSMHLTFLWPFLLSVPINFGSHMRSPQFRITYLLDIQLQHGLPSGSITEATTIDSG
jgi:hypothetical protein